MNSHTQVLGTIFVVMVTTTMGLGSVLTEANAMDFDVSDFKCIVLVGQQNNNCNEDNRLTQETTNNLDNSTTTNYVDNGTDNGPNMDCSGQGTNANNQQSSGTDASFAGNNNQTIDLALCNGISLPV